MTESQKESLLRLWAPLAVIAFIFISSWLALDEDGDPNRTLYSMIVTCLLAALFIVGNYFYRVRK